MERAPRRRASATAAANSARPAPRPIAGGSTNITPSSPSGSTRATPTMRSSSIATRTRPEAMSASLTVSDARLNRMNASS